MTPRASRCSTATGSTPCARSATCRTSSTRSIARVAALLVGARKECPLIIGRGEDETFIGSAIPAFLAHTRQVQYIENGEIVAVTPDAVTFLTPAGEELARDVVTVDWDEETAEKGG